VLENGVPLGLPINHTRVYVLDGDMQVCPLGVPGELYVGGAGLARGYLNRSDLTGERFVPDPFSAEGERLYRTGDRVRWRRDGVLEFLGRVDHQVKVRGFRIEPGEIEAALKSQPHVREALVIARDDGPGGKQLVGYVVAERGAALDGATLRQALRELLPEYMVPAFVIVLPQWPLTPNGKLDRRALPSPSQRSGTYRAPRTPQEEILCGIFSEVLSVERVGIDDNFFNLGGHSLLATRLASRVRALLGVELPLRKLFELPTVAGVASQLRQAEKARAPLVRQQRPERLPLSYAQQRLWFIDQLQGGSTEYNMVEALRLRGELDRSALERAVAAIVDRHEVLRTRFVEVDGRAVQVIVPELRIRVPLEDLSGMSRASQEQRIEAALWREREQPFDLSRGPMLRLRLLKLGEEEHVLLRSFHHIVSDGWSQGIFNRELAELYGAYRRGEESGLEPLSVQYADFAVWQRRWLDEEAMGRELEYWKEQLAGIPGQLELPRDRPRPARQTFAAQLHREVLGKEELAGVKGVGQKGQATLYMVLLACFAVLLERYSGQEDIVVGTPIANRQEAELEQLIGFFVNSLVMRVRVREEERFRELLEQVRETALAAYAHQELPFERLVEELSPERSLNTTPVYQVMFALQNAPVEMQELAGLEVERIRSGRMTVRFDLELHAWERQGELEFNWVYNPDLFDAWRIEQMARHYIRLLKASAERPDVEIAALAELSPQEREQVLASKEQMQEEVQKEPGHAGVIASHRGSEIARNDYVAPQTPLEHSLTQIWAELLRLDRVGVDDNFFDVGGHSLLMMELRSAVKQKLDRHLPIVDFFTYSTIRSFARHLECTNEKSLSSKDSQRRAEGRREYLLARKRPANKRPA
jgi:acyl carrier protein